MRAVVLSYSHHGFGMGRTAVQLGHDLVGAFDLLESERTTMADTFGCPIFDSAAECLEAVQTDVALVSGRHTLAPDYLQACVDAERALSVRQALGRLRRPPATCS